ncbi:MAG: MFS transporter [Chloroflexota bacterium]
MRDVQSQSQGGSSPLSPRDSASEAVLPGYHRSVVLFCTTNFLFWACLHLYVPILPVYAQHLGASLSIVGLIVASYSIPQLLLRIPIGVLFDASIYRKRLVAAEILLALTGAAGLAMATGPWHLFFARALTGIGAAGWVIFSVYFTGYFLAAGTRRAIGLINFVQGLALVVASLSGGLIAEHLGSKYAFVTAAALGVLALVPLALAKQPPVVQVVRFSWGGFTAVAARPLLLVASSLGILAQFANWAGLFGFIPVYATTIGASKTDLGIITMVSLASSAIASLAAAWLLQRFGNSATILIGSVLLGLSIVIVPFIHSVPLLQSSMVLNGLGRGLTATTFMTISVQAVEPQNRATAMGVYQASYAIGMVSGPVVSGFVADNLGLATVFYVSAAICGIMAVLAYLPALRGKQ